jgi:DNA-binding NarL/FixJ family response regulator
MTIRVLIVDDHEFWRSHISSVLRENLQCEVIGEAADGPEAVQQAERLKPDLIVLDVGLPTLNGIEVARRILAGAPDSKILFLSEHRSPEVAQAALATGADGYVIKSDAGSEFLPAIDAIIQGRPFVSARFAGHGLEEASRARVAQKTRRHEVEVCQDEASMLDGFARFAAASLESGSAAIVVTTSSHRTMLQQRVRACGLDVDRAIEEGRYVWRDVADTLSAVMVDGLPDEARFWKAATTLVAAAARSSTRTPARVTACGECARTLWSGGNAAAAIRLEHLWDELARTHGVDVLCGYSVDAPLPDEQHRFFERICAEHSAVRSR